MGRQRLAAGEMTLAVDAPIELVWGNEEPSETPEQRPAGFPEEHRLPCRIIEVDPPRRPGFTWGGTRGAVIELKPRGQEVLLTRPHGRLSDGATLLNVRAG